MFFLAGTTGGDAMRTCTVPADTPLFFPVINVVCSEAPTVPTDGGFTGDPEPYSKCAKQLVHSTLKGEGDPFAGTDISRNAPCPCGSGNKYKHCHGAA